MHGSYNKKEDWVINMILLIYFLKYNCNNWFESEESTHTKRKSE